MSRGSGRFYEGPRRESWDDDSIFENRLRSRPFSQERRRKSGHGCLKGVLLVLALLCIGGGIVGRYVWSSTQNYVSLDTPIKVAEICAVKISQSRPAMNVHVILYGKDGSTPLNFSELTGDHVQVQGDIIKYWSVLNPVVQSVYKLTYLQGYDKEEKSESVPLNGGDDAFYERVRGLPATPIIQTLNDKPLSWSVVDHDGQTYDIFASLQGGLNKIPVKGQVGCGFNNK